MGAPTGRYTKGLCKAFAFAPASVGDAEVLGQAPFWEHGGYGYFGASGLETGRNFGSFVVALDVNGDGLDDLAVSDPRWTKYTGYDAGRVDVFTGPLGDKSQWAFEAPATNWDLGSVLAGGDVNAEMAMTTSWLAHIVHGEVGPPMLSTGQQEG